MPRHTWLFAGILSALLLAAVGLLAYRENAARAAQSEAAARDAAAAAEAAARTNAVLAAELAGLRSRAAELEDQVRKAAASRDALEQQMHAELESRDVTISDLQGRLTVDILDRVLFDVGEAELKPEGQAVLSKVARIVAGLTNRPVQVVGHTDNLPIVNRTRGGFTDNWGLSAGRATAAVRFLVDKAGIDPRRLTAVGCGEFRPIADNATPEGRARNRRIAVVILPLDVTDIPRTNAPPAAPEAVPAPEAPPRPGA